MTRLPALLLSLFILTQVTVSLSSEAESKDIRSQVKERQQVIDVENSRVLRDAAKKGKKSIKGQKMKKYKKSQEGKTSKNSSKGAKTSKKGRSKSKKVRKLKKGKQSKKSKKGKQPKKSKKSKKGSKKGRKAAKAKRLQKSAKKSKKSSKKKKKNMSKSKKIMKKNKQRRLKKKKNRQDTGGSQACTGGGNEITLDDMQAVFLAMEFQRNQITNFNNQKKRVESQMKIISGKGDKSVDFLTPAMNLGSALGLNNSADNMTNTAGASCGDGLTEATQKEGVEATEDYLNLVNCSKYVAEVCNKTVYGAAEEANYEKCQTQITEYEDGNKECLTKKVGEAGACWQNQVKALEEIKKSDCLSFSSNLNTEVTKVKKLCVEQVFRDCKKLEDRAVEHSANCTSGKVKSTDEVNKEVIHTKETVRKSLKLMFDPTSDIGDADEDDF